MQGENLAEGSGGEEPPDAGARDQHLRAAYENTPDIAWISGVRLASIRLRFGEGKSPVVEFVVGLDLEHHLAERGVDGDALLFALEEREIFLLARGVDAILAGGLARGADLAEDVADVLLERGEVGEVLDVDRRAS